MSQRSYLLLIVLFSCLSFMALAQDAQNASPATHSTTEPSTSATATAPLPDSTKLEIVKAEKARYPLEAHQQEIQGEVLLKLHISETGDVESVDVISGHPALVPSAVDAAKKWKFKPYIKNGKPIKVSVNVPMDFAFKGNIVKDEHGAAQSTAPPPSSGNKLNVDSKVMRGRLVYKVAPVYPTEARRAHVEGTVTLQASIGKDGRIHDLTLISGPKELVDSAVGAVQQWRYSPYLKDGEAVEVSTQIQVNYQLRW